MVGTLTHASSSLPAVNKDSHHSFRVANDTLGTADDHPSPGRYGTS